MHHLPRLPKVPRAAFSCMCLCGEQISGIKAGVHAVRSAFTLDKNEAVLLVNASNAVNSLNRQAASVGSAHLSPPS